MSSGQCSIEMPSQCEPGQGEGYSLFPAKGRRGGRGPLPPGRGRRQESLADTSMDWRADKPPTTQRAGPAGARLGLACKPSHSYWGERGGGGGEGAWRREGGARSFAEMVKQPAGGSAGVARLEEGGEEVKASKPKRKQKARPKGAAGEQKVEGESSRQTKPCLTRVVLNQISASTYGRIGR